MSNNNIPKHWQVKKLGDVCDEIFAGGDVPKNNFSLTLTEVHQIPIYANGEKNKGLYGYTNISRVNSPSVTISARGTIGYAEVRNKPFFPIVRLIVLKPNNNLDVIFLKYAIDNCKIQHTGSSIPQLTVPTVKTLSIPIPPLPEQQAIVSKIEELLSDLENGKQQLQTAQQQLKIYKQSLLQAAFEGKLTNKNVIEGELPKGWRWVKIEDIASVGTGATPLKGNSKYYEGGKIAWVTSGALNNEFVKVATDYVTELALKETNLSVYPKHTLLLAMYGEGKTRGKCSELLIEASTNQAIAAIHFINNNERVKPFLKYFLLKNYNDIRRLSSGGVQPNLNLGIVKKTLIPLPTIEEQQKIVQELESKLTVCDKIEETISQSLQQAETLRQSILKKAFEGKLI